MIKASLAQTGKRAVAAKLLSAAEGHCFLLGCGVAVDGLDLSRLVNLSQIVVHELLFLNGLRHLAIIYYRLESVLLLKPGLLAVGILLVSSRLLGVDHVGRDVSERSLLLILPFHLRIFHEIEARSVV